MKPARPLRRVANSPGLGPELLRPADGPRRMPSWLPKGRTVLLACARHGLYHGWRALGLPAGSAVLVPAFVCNSVTEPLLLAGARLVFFGVRGDLSPDLDHAAEAAARAWRSSRGRGQVRVRALLWYHYLGFPAGMLEARSFCRERGLFLFEDCAHALPVGGPGRPAGSWGDLAVFSIRKVLPVTNAGALVINNRALLPLPELPWSRPDGAYVRTLRDKELSLRRLDEERGPAGRRLARAALLRHVEYVSRLNSPRRPVREATRRHLHDPDRPLQRMARPVAPDELSLQVMQNADLAGVARARRRNYRAYLRRIGELALFPRLPAGVAPLGFSIRVPDRDAFRLRLARRGVESTTHWPDWLLPAGARRGFTAARHLADTLLTLPCHQGLRPEDVEFACRAVAQSWRR
jgi:dTDP-4-amino-4,6-dideoxygalactose transaminase